ncbi:hypothetical protein COCCADRAFT_110483, partial [Bipolaris zeicola 26-R-13]
SAYSIYSIARRPSDLLSSITYRATVSSAESHQHRGTIALLYFKYVPSHDT